jgi:hypothetical protein
MPLAPGRLALLVMGLTCCAAADHAGGIRDWGFYGHKRINRMACYTLPQELFGFYKRHIDVVSDHGVDADGRRSVDPEEAARHYIDIDHYAPPGMDPFWEVPQQWHIAVAKFTEDTLKAYGILPWHIAHTYQRLVAAQKVRHLDRILQLSADLGHYLADAHVPLHTTENYNGQLTGQHGIHALWESRIPELSAQDYDHFVGKAAYVNDVLNASWNAVFTSHQCVDSVLDIERELASEWPADKRYTYEDAGSGTARKPTREFALAYELALNGMVQRRMNAAIHLLGSMWYSAWVDAGQPDMEELTTRSVSDSLKRVFAAEETRWREARKSSGRDHQE